MKFEKNFHPIESYLLRNWWFNFSMQRTTLESHRRPRNAIDKDIEDAIRSEIIPLNPSEETDRK